MDAYKTLADVYDKLNPKEEIFKQKPLFETLVDKYKVKTVLDCACGTGWHLKLFKDMGLEVYGSDLSPDMLEKASSNLQDGSVELKELDYRNLGDWNKQFDMVGCLTTSLPYMTTAEDVVAALNSMYEALNNGGILVISNGISDALLDEKPKFIPGRLLDDDAFFFFMEYPDAKSVTFNILYVGKKEKGFDYRFTSTTYNAMRKSVLEDAFSQTKFKTVNYYGDETLAPYDAKSPRLIVVAEK